MKLLLSVLLSCISLTAFADMERVSVSTNEPAMSILLENELVIEQTEKLRALVTELGIDMPQDPVWVTSKVSGLPRDTDLDAEQNNGQSHQFFFENDDSTWGCNFEVYVIWQNTVPYTISTQYSAIDSEAICHEIKS